MGEEKDKNSQEKKPEEIKEELKREVESEKVEKDVKENEIREDGKLIDQAIDNIESSSKKNVVLNSQQEENIRRAIVLSYKRIEEVRQKKVIPKTEAGKILFEKIIEKKIDEKLLQDPFSSLRIYSLLEKAILSDSLTLDDLKINFKKLKDFYGTTNDFIEKWSEVLIDTAVSLGYKKEEVKDYFTLNESEKNIHSMTNTSQILLSRLSHEDREFYVSLDNVNNFNQYVKIIDQRIDDQVDKSITGERRKREKAIRLSKYINDRISSIIFNIYQAASHHPNEQFDHIERHGPFSASPADFYLNFSQKFENLNNQIEELTGGISDLYVSILQKKEIKGVLTDDGQELPPTFAYTGEYELVNLGHKHGLKEFFERIHQFAQSEKKRLETGHNLRFLVKTAMHNEKVKQEGFFRALGGFVSHIESSDIDEIFFDPEMADLVQQTLSFFESTLEKEMMENNWLKKPELASRYFDSLHRYEKIMIDELRKRRPDLHEWQILRIITNANIVFLGTNYQLMHYFSFADPDRAAFGSSGTTSDAGDLMFSIYDPGMTQRRFQGNNMTGYGADWMPINVSLDTFNHTDWEKFRDAYNASLTRGRVAYFSVLPKDWKTVRLGVDPGNISEAGGFTSLRKSTWRLWNAYKYWLGETNLNFATEGLKGIDKRTDVYTDIWKRLENLGIDVLENFFIYKGNGVAGGNIEEKNKKFKFGNNRKENLLNLFGYLYDRYFDQKIAGQKMADVFLNFNGKTLNRDQFLKYIQSNIDLDVFSYSDVDKFLKEIYNDVFTVMILERLPTKLLTLEKQRLTQNGIRLYDEVRNKYFSSIYFSLFSGDSYEKMRDAYVESISDLSYVESSLRVYANNKMRELKEHKGNLYGDLSKLRSEVGYWMSEEKIEIILGKYLKSLGLSNEIIRKRIELAKATYRGIIQRGAMIPEKASWEFDIEEKKKKLLNLKRKIKKSNEDKKTIEELEKELGAFINKDYRKDFTSRIKWFSKMLVDDDFGFSFTSGDLSYHFLNFSANGPSLLHRLAGFNFDTAETISKRWMMDGAWYKDRSNYNLAESYKIMDEVYNSSIGQWGLGYQPSKVVATFLRRTFTFFRKDEEMYSDFEKIRNRFFGEKPERSSSFSQKSAGGPKIGNVYEWGLNEMDQIIHESIGGRSNQYFSYKTSKKEELYKYEDFEESNKFLGKILNKFFSDKEPPKFIKKRLGIIKKDGRFYKKIRDYANEVSGEAIKKTQRYRGGFLWKEIMPRLALLILIITLILAFKSAKDDFEIGKGKK
ncbi:MAG: hypothetical protein NZM02_01090 [Patescibacteria group bacterium]|nr:hypothetical protein [Patescibacteria group bacterium]